MHKPKEILKKYFNHDSFRGLQEKIIDRTIYQKGHSLVLMPTGGGKSLCYQVPALIFDGGTIVISPLIALMQDQVDALRKKNIPAGFINSTLSKKDRESRLEDFIAGKIKLLYVTPERFRKGEFVDKIKSTNISLLAVDEAHCISEWGHDFRPDYSRLAEFREWIGNPLTIALTATATPEVQKDIIDKLNIKKEEIEIFHQGIERPNLRLEAVDIFDDKEKFAAIFTVLNKYFPQAQTPKEPAGLPTPKGTGGQAGAGIIYFALIQTLEKFSQVLGDAGCTHGVYHGKLPDKQRKLMQREFLNGKQKLILATNAFGMGIDKPDIRFVIHAEVPSSIEAYYQEIGRAGRDGLDSVCQLLYNQDDLYTQMEFIKWSNPGADFYSALYDLLIRDIEAVNSVDGIEHIREMMNFKNRKDFRIETALGMFDRYGVTEGSIDYRDLKLISELPEELHDEDRIKKKLLNDNKKLLSVVNYFRGEDCRRVFISDYFGFRDEKPCGNCDNCSIEMP